MAVFYDIILEFINLLFHSIMKTINLLILFVFFASVSLAQEVEKNFVPYYLENGEVKNFERVSSKIEAKSIGFGYGGVNQYLTVFDKKYSPVKFKMGEIPKFIIQVDPGTDVMDLVVISKADVVKKRKKYRRFIQKGYAMGGRKDMSEHLNIPTLKKIGENLYEMQFDEPLKVGQYAFQPIYKGTEAANIMGTLGDVRIYCFDVIE